MSGLNYECRVCRASRFMVFTDLCVDGDGHDVERVCCECLACGSKTRGEHLVDAFEAASAIRGPMSDMIDAAIAAATDPKMVAAASRAAAGLDEKTA